MAKRITYQNWIVKMGHDPADQSAVDIPPSAERLFEKLLESSDLTGDSDQTEGGESRAARTIKAVREGMEQLNEQEREFIHLYYFLGRSYRRISENSGRAIHRLEALHARAIRRLKSILAEFASREFGVEIVTEQDCPICQSDSLEEINELIDAKLDRETWSRTIVILKSRFGLTIKTPQVLIGHQKFHRKSEEK